MPRNLIVLSQLVNMFSMILVFLPSQCCSSVLRLLKLFTPLLLDGVTCPVFCGIIAEIVFKDSDKIKMAFGFLFKTFFIAL